TFASPCRPGRLRSAALRPLFRDSNGMAKRRAVEWQAHQEHEQEMACAAARKSTWGVKGCDEGVGNWRFATRQESVSGKVHQAHESYRSKREDLNGKA